MLMWTAATPLTTNWYNFLIFCVLGFGTATKDDGSSRQNGYSQNRHLREAHQTLDKNLGKPKCSALVVIPPRWWS